MVNALHISSHLIFIASPFIDEELTFREVACPKENGKANIFDRGEGIGKKKQNILNGVSMPKSL